MRNLIPVLIATGLAISPASAAVLGVSGAEIGAVPTVFRFGSNSFSFTYDAAAAAAFDPATYSVQTSGTAQTSAFGGFLSIPLVPSLFDQSGVTIDGNLFPSYAAFSSSTPIPFSLVPGDLALRYLIGPDSFYGYARLNGNSTLDVAFESQPNTAITAGSAITGPLIGAVPEPEAWAVIFLGFGAIGFQMRRRPRAVSENHRIHSM